MKRFLALLAVFLALPLTVLADETAEILKENKAGKSIILTTSSPAYIQNVGPITTVKDTTVKISFYGTGAVGRAFTITWVNNSSSADTLWKFYPNRAAVADSSWLLGLPGTSIFNVLIAEGDSIRIDKVSGSGSSYGYIGGVKNVY